MVHNRIFTLSEAAFDHGTEHDIMMLYQILLGRGPEDLTVVRNHCANTLNVALYAFVTSMEFRNNVLGPIRNDGKVRRQDSLSRPSDDQLAWLFSRAVLDESQKTNLGQAASWEQFFRHLCSLQGFLEPHPAPAFRHARYAKPVRSRFRPMSLSPDVAAAARQPPAIAYVADPRAAPSNTDVMVKLGAIEAMLAELLRRSRQSHTGGVTSMIGQNEDSRADCIPAAAQDRSPIRRRRRT